MAERSVRQNSRESRGRTVKPLTKPDFANVCVGTALDNVSTGFRYRIRERVCRTLILERVTPMAGLPLVLVVRIGERSGWMIAEVSL
jgi:hypothetical protein